MPTRPHQLRDAFEALVVVLPTDKAEQSHYWHIQKRNKKGQWDTVKQFIGTKREAAVYWTKQYRWRNDGNQYRLHHMLTYGK